MTIALHHQFLRADPVVSASAKDLARMIFINDIYGILISEESDHAKIDALRALISETNFKKIQLGHSDIAYDPDRAETKCNPLLLYAMLRFVSAAREIRQGQIKTNVLSDLSLLCHEVIDAVRANDPFAAQLLAPPLTEGVILDAERGYDAIADGYDSSNWQDILPRFEQPIIRNLLEEAERENFPQRVLEIGVGTGGNLDFIQRHFCNAVCAGTDISDGMLAIARKRLKPGTMLIKGNAKHLEEFDSSSFSHVFLCRVINHVDNLPKVMAEATRVTLPYGKILVTSIHPDHPYKNTRYRISDRTIAIETHKHSVDWDPMMRFLFLKEAQPVQIIHRSDIAKLPGVRMPLSILGADRPVAMMRVFEKI